MILKHTLMNLIIFFTFFLISLSENVPSYFNIGIMFPLSINNLPSNSLTYFNAM